MYRQTCTDRHAYPRVTVCAQHRAIGEDGVSNGATRIQTAPVRAASVTDNAVHRTVLIVGNFLQQHHRDSQHDTEPTRYKCIQYYSHSVRLAGVLVIVSSMNGTFRKATESFLKTTRQTKQNDHMNLTKRDGLGV